MDQEYDVIVCGTGLKECILSGLMSQAGKKVLHVDRNSYYGGESASLNLEQLYEKFKPGQTPPAELGRTRDYCIDLCPKFLMACGNLVKVLLHTKVTKYLEFKSVTGSYVVKGGKAHKVPATASEALASPLMGMFQKRKFKNFVEYVNDFDEKTPATHKGVNPNTTKTKEVYDKFGLDEDTQQFTGHALALHLSDAYLNEPFKETLDTIKLYAYSMARYGNSPYIYPIYGLGGLPEGFSRLCAIHGGTYMLNKPIDTLVYEGGKVVGVKDTEGVTAKAPMVICDPSYVLNTPEKLKKVGRIVRCIAIMSHPVPDTNNADSCQIIIPAHQVRGRRSDIYISVVSFHHKIAADGKFIAVISANLEGSDEKSEIEPAVKLLGKIDQAFVWVSDHYVPAPTNGADGVWVSSSYDATSHFETATDEVISLYEKITGKPIDLSISADLNADDE